MQEALPGVFRGEWFLRFGKLTAPSEGASWGCNMKVKCDCAYASFLKAKYRGRLFIYWQNGVMTVATLTLGLCGICEE
jgi:hypothetical protein